MDKVEWTDALSVGIPLIDEQHKQLMKHISEFSDAVRGHKATPEIVSTLNYLVDYTDFHFATEEKHMTANDYPAYDEHKQKHEEFKRTVANLGEDFEEEGATPALADSINTLLGNWFVKHIEAVDQVFGSFLKEQGIALEETA